MAAVKKIVLIEFTPVQMFDLVDRCEDYPKFLPWCGGSEVQSRDEKITRATLHINYHGIKSHFSTENEKHYQSHMLFAKFAYRGRTALMLLMISAQMFPFAVLLITLYPLMEAAGLLNTRAGLIISYIVFALPSGTYMLYSYFINIPTEVIEAARADGASELRILTVIVLPLSIPGLVTVGLDAFMWAWNDLLYSLTLITDPSLRTVGPGLLLSYLGESRNDWGGAMASSLIASLPVVVTFALVQRFFIQWTRPTRAGMFMPTGAIRPKSARPG